MEGKGAWGHILQLQRFSTHDGDGIRTVVFFMGCPLRCRWCANPETWTSIPKLAFYRHKCTGCGACIRGCKMNHDPRQGCFENCAKCGDCLRGCPRGALTRLGFPASADEVAAKVRQDEPFYRYSGGGVTFSGGEPTMQPFFLRSLANALAACGIDLWLETCGVFDYGEVRDIFSLLSHVFFDLKIMDETRHLAYTGKSNRGILENAKMVYNQGVPLTIRIPCIPGVSLTKENIEATAVFIGRHLPGADVELLAYHRLGEDKYPAIGMARENHVFSVPSRTQMLQAAQWLEEAGAKVVSYL